MIKNIILALALSTFVMAADDDPTSPMSVTNTFNVVFAPPPDTEYIIRMWVTPVTKLQGTNVASVTKIEMEKLQNTVVVRDGITISNVVVSIGTKDITRWVKAGTNVNGRVLVNLSDGSATWAQRAWNNN